MRLPRWWHRLYAASTGYRRSPRPEPPPRRKMDPAERRQLRGWLDEHREYFADREREFADARAGRVAFVAESDRFAALAWFGAYSAGLAAEREFGVERGWGSDVDYRDIHDFVGGWYEREFGSYFGPDGAPSVDDDDD
jgi:hypothetical protein